MKQKIGTMQLGEIAFLSDPCYGTNSIGNCTMQMIPGEYIVFITKSSAQWCEGRISSIYAVHKDFYKTFKKRPSNDQESLFCAVDSGTCGIFSADYYEKYHDPNGVDDDWYEENVIGMDKFKITDNQGAISSSGLGDGFYPVYAEYKDGKAFALRIKFL
jgi:hypothetical protein